MAMTFLSQASSKLQNPFVLNALIPTAVFVPVYAAIVVQSIWGVDYLLNGFVALPSPLQVALPLASFAAIWFVASLVASEWLFIVQMFEGAYVDRFWGLLGYLPALGRIVRMFPVPGTSGQLFRRTSFKMRAHDDQGDPSADAEFDLNYDSEDPYVLPTSLGNILNAAEMYPEHRYGIDSVVFWTRLAMLMPEHVLTEMQTMIDRYQLPLVIAAFGGMLSLLSIVPALSGDKRLFNASIWGGVVICLFGYFASLRSARYYGTTLRSAFDVYRDLLAKNWPSLETIDTERAGFMRIREFVVRGRVSKSPPPLPKGEKGPSLQRRARRGKKEEINGWRPRLSLIYLGVWIALWAVGYKAIDFNHREYVVTTADVRAYSALQSSVQKATRPYRHFVHEALPVRALGTALVATRPLKAGTILTADDAVQLKAMPSRLVQVTTPSARVTELGIEAGTAIELLFSGKADFESDPTCRKAEYGGVPRSISGDVLSVVSISSTERSVVVGVPNEEAVMLACYGSGQPSIIRRTLNTG